jgi:hypothetical protein
MNKTKKTKMRLAAFSLALGAVAIVLQVLVQTRDVKLDRTVLPIPEPNYPRSTVLDAPRLRRVSRSRRLRGRRTSSSSSWTTWALDTAVDWPLNG